MTTPEDPALLELREHLAADEVVLFVGAGPSAAAGLPLWGQLVDVLVAHARNRGLDPASVVEAEDLRRSGQLLDALSALEHLLGPDEFGTIIERALRVPERPLPEVLNVLGELSSHCRGVLTTNLDTLLERACGGRLEVLDRPTTDLAQRRAFLLKLHGTLSNRSSWIMTRAQYERAIYVDPIHQATFASLLRSRRLLFVGFGLADGDFDLVLGLIRAAASGQASRHFALVPAESILPHRRRSLESAGVRLIGYPNPDKTHAALVPLLRSLRPAPRTRDSGKVYSDLGESVPRFSDDIGSTVSEAARAIVDERSFLWEYELLSQALFDELRKSDDLRRDWKSGMSVQRPERIGREEFFGLVGFEFRDLTRHAENYDRVFKVVLPEALGPAGVPGSPDALAYVARRLADIHRGALEWAVRSRRYLVEEEFETLVSMMEPCAECYVDAIEEFLRQLQSAIATARVQHAAGEPVTVGVNVVLTSDKVVELNRELARVTDLIAT